MPATNEYQILDNGCAAGLHGVHSLNGLTPGNTPQIVCFMNFDPDDKEALVKLAKMTMPFGKYRGRLLIDLPEAYLMWFSRKGFPDGQLGQLLALCLEVKINGLQSLIEPLKDISRLQ